MALDLFTILTYWIPFGFGLVGIFVFLAGAIKLVTGKDRAFSNMFSGIFIILVAIGLRLLIQWVWPQIS
jgi:hypothetical protein